MITAVDQRAEHKLNPVDSCTVCRSDHLFDPKAILCALLHYLSAADWINIYTGSLF